MPAYRLFVANLPDEGGDYSLVFADWGEVAAVEPFAGSNISAPEGKVWVVLKTEHRLWDVLEAVNGYQWGERRLLVSPGVVVKEDLPPRLPDDLWRLCKQIADTLGEKEAKPRQAIKDIMRSCGAQFALVMLEEALAIEAAGGLMLPDGSRRRTPGGVFFHLFRQFASPAVGKWVHNRSYKVNPRQRPAARREPLPDPQPASVVAPPPDPLAEPRARLAALRQHHQAAQQDLQARQSGQKQGGLLTAMKQVLELQREIEALLADYPDLV